MLTLCLAVGIINGVMTRFIDTGCSYSETYEPEHIYTFTGNCVVTEAPYSVSVKGSELFQMRQTNSIMALKSLCVGDREFLMSGISPLGWEKKYGDQADWVFSGENFERSCGHFKAK